jgi:hypothetical protein
VTHVIRCVSRHQQTEPLPRALGMHRRRCKLELYCRAPGVGLVLDGVGPWSAGGE